MRNNTLARQTTPKLKLEVYHEKWEEPDKVVLLASKEMYNNSQMQRKISREPRIQTHEEN